MMKTCPSVNPWIGSRVTPLSNEGPLHCWICGLIHLSNLQSPKHKTCKDKVLNSKSCYVPSDWSSPQLPNTRLV